jgi:hypothetical protein
VQYTRGNDLNLEGKTNYDKILVRIDYGFQWRRIGKTSVQFVSGQVKGNVPYARLFNGKGNLTENADLRAVSMNCFETMRMNEFASDQFVSGFFHHDFGSFFKIKNFSPRFVIVQNMLFGKMSGSNVINQNGITFKQANRGFLESGLQINNLLILNTGGYGIGGYYRFGNYASSKWKENLAVKLSLTLNF